MDKALSRRITAFFNYWRTRYDFISALDFEKYNHEANVLLWSSLDALSSLWAKNIGKNECNNKSSRLIFDAFLARYGGELFHIVSLPDVWHRVHKKETLKLPQDVCTFLSKIGNRRIPTVEEERKTRQTSDDCNLDKIITATLEYCPETNRKELEEWLVLSRYGAIAYKEMRNAYIHEGRPGKNTHSFDLDRSAKQPTYLSSIYSTPPKISFSVEFILGVLKCCIDEFEKEALELLQDPAPLCKNKN